MQDAGLRNPTASLESVGLKGYNTAHWNFAPEALVVHTIAKGMGHLADSGALVINTGEFTGRSPEDRFIVMDNITKSKVHWGKVNKAFDAKKFDQLWRKACSYLRSKDLYVRDVIANASAYTLYAHRVRVITE